MTAGHEAKPSWCPLADSSLYNEVANFTTVPGNFAWANLDRALAAEQQSQYENIVTQTSKQMCYYVIIYSAWVDVVCMFSVRQVCLYILRAWFNCAENGYRSGWKVAKLTNEETMRRPSPVPTPSRSIFLDGSREAWSKCGIFRSLNPTWRFRSTLC